MRAPLAAAAPLAALFYLAFAAPAPGRAPQQQAQDAEGRPPVARTPPEADPDEPPVYEERVVVVGTRAKPRSVTDSPAPIDAIPQEELAGPGDADLSNQLRAIVPSYHVNMQPISDAATIVRPVNLRGLAPDHTLVLVNGKRRHRSAVINWLGNGAADGAQGPDISVIPAIALRQVEVLRDGAAAQYGSDAIAGVLNFLLKDDSSGGSVEVRTGGHLDRNSGDPASYADAGGRGRTTTVAANLGLPLGENGFANLSLEYGGAEPTNRSTQRNDAQAIIDAGNPFVRDPAQVWGSPEIDGEIKFLGNFGVLLGNGAQLYSHVNYASKTVEGGFYFRNPNTRNGIYSADGGATLLVGDVLEANGQGSANCPTVAITDNVPDPAALEQVFADPHCFSFQETFPGGFTPQFGGDSVDSSAVVGMRGSLPGGLAWDAYASVGAHDVDLFIHDTVNASLGPESPTAFRPGSNRQQETTLGIDFSWPLSETLNLAAGAEWRDEVFRTGLGQTESWLVGSYGRQGFASTSNGFPGYGPLAAGKWSRGNAAVYADLEVRDKAETWLLAAAARVEDFEDFGLTTNAKIAGRYSVNDRFALRSSVSSGFRAPTPGQANVFNLSSEFSQAANDFVINGTIPPTSRVAMLRGGELLEPETSMNYTFGAVFRSGSLTLTADLFRIDLADRLGISQNFSLSRDEVDGLLEEGIESARDLESFRFFTNAFDTRTRGIDIVSTWTPARWGGATTIDVALNSTDTEVADFDTATLDAVRVREIQEATPGQRWNASVRHDFGPARVFGRIHYYGGWWDTEDVLFYGGEHLLDLEVTVPLRASTSLVVGGQNVLNTYPEEHPFAADRLGNLYSQFTPFGFNGAYFYTRIVHAWRSRP